MQINGVGQLFRRDRRMIAYKDGTTVRLISRNNVDHTERFREPHGEPIPRSRVSTSEVVSRLHDSHFSAPNLMSRPDVVSCTDGTSSAPDLRKQRSFAVPPLASGLRLRD